LRLKILERDTEPVTLEDAVRVASRLEAVRKTADDEYVEEVKKREKNIRGAAQPPEKKIAELETTVDSYRKELDRMKLLTEQLQQRVVMTEERDRTNASHSYPGRWDDDPPRWSGSGGQYPSAQGRGYSGRRNGPGRWTRGRLSRDECRKCGAHGHWWRDCPQSQQQSADEVVEGTARTQVIGPVGEREYETYLEAEVDGKTIAFLLDSGCCTNILPARMVDPDEIRPISSQLMAVNKSPIEIIGTVTWQLTFGRQTLPVKFEVTNVVDEAILGTKFLFGCECEWEFAEKKN